MPERYKLNGKNQSEKDALREFGNSRVGKIVIGMLLRDSNALQAPVTLDKELLAFISGQSKAAWALFHGAGAPLEALKIALGSEELTYREKGEKSDG